MAKSRAMCSGCRNNFYNGNNDIGVKECWSFKSAKVVTRMRVGTWQPPPYIWNPQKVLSCYHESGASFIERSDSRVQMRKRGVTRD